MALDQAPYFAALAPLRVFEGCEVTFVETPRRNFIRFDAEIDSKVIVSVPPGVTPEMVATVASNESHRLREGIRAARDIPVKELVDGEHFTLRGETYRLQITDDGAPARIGRLPHVQSTDERLCVRRDAPSRMHRAIVDLYCELGLAWAKAAGTKYEAYGSIAPGLTYAVEDIGRNRWGRYEPGPHRVKLHWATFGLPYEQIVNILVHELAHASHPYGEPHGPAWRNRMRMWVPNWVRLEANRAEAERHVWLGDYRAISTTPISALKSQPPQGLKDRRGEGVFKAGAQPNMKES